MNATRIKSRLSKLLAVASDAAATPGEIENAMKLASELMAEHHLSPDDVLDNAEHEIGRVCIELKRRVFDKWRPMLSSFAALVVGGVQPMRVKRTDQNGRKHLRIEFVGRTNEIEMAKWCYELLERAIVTKTAEHKLGTPNAGKGAAYAYGFVLGLAEARRRAQPALTAGSDAEHKQLAVIQNAKLEAAMAWARAQQAAPIRTAPKTKMPNDRAEMDIGIRDGFAHEVKVEKPQLALT